jgi:hemolysin III
VSIPSGAALVTTASGSAHETEAIVYALTAFVMFTTSAAYHRLAQSVLARFWMRRLDHSMIFLHMAGTTTVLALSCIGGSAGRAIVGVAWTLAAVGMALKLTRLTADHDPCCWMFPILGTVPMLAVPGMVLSQRADSALLLVAAFFLYAAGAACFVRKAPDPRPSVFGYHEIWHVFTLLAGACEFLVVLDSVGD